VCVCVCVYYIYIYTHTHIHTYVYTYIHTYICLRHVPVIYLCVGGGVEGAGGGIYSRKW
jgi:hypothetical protein